MTIKRFLHHLALLRFTGIVHDQGLTAEAGGTRWGSPENDKIN